MDVETTQIAAACLGIGTVILCRRPKKNRERKIWVKPRTSTRETDGAFDRLLDLEGDPEHYSNYLRLDFATFEELVQIVYPFLRKRDTKMRNAISPAEQLSVTLRFLPTGETYTSLRINKGTLSLIIPRACEAISTVLASYTCV